jgi:thiol:disulfide interchange protein DsbD
MTIKHRLLIPFLTLIALTLTTSSWADSGGDFNDEEPLMPDEAFAISSKVIDANTLRVEWKIADKYYLYKNKFKFISDTDGIVPGEINFPKGQIKKDEFFGNVEIYHDHVAVDIPLARTGNADILDMKITSQGCAEMGVCYPPQTKTIAFKLPAAMAAETAAETAPTTSSSTNSSSNNSSSNFNPLDALKKLGNNLGITDSSDNFLPSDQAFVYSAEAIDGNTLRAHWDIADGVYLYQKKFEFELKDANGITLGTPVLPKGDKKVDESLGE